MFVLPDSQKTRNNEQKIRALSAPQHGRKARCEERHGDGGVAPAGRLPGGVSGVSGAARPTFVAPVQSSVGAGPRGGAPVEVPSRWRPEGQASLEERPGRALGNTADNVSRRDAYDLRDAIRPFAVRERVRDCGYRIAPFADHVEIRRSEGRSKLHLGGLVRCESPWECAGCARQIRAQHSADIATVVQGHAERFGPRSILFATFTIRHGWGDDLEQLTKGLSKAWRRLQQGREWAEWKRLNGGIGHVRTLEVTHGGNGFHPHLHVLLLLDQPLSDEAETQDHSSSDETATLKKWRELLVRRWSSAVDWAFRGDAAFQPSAERGVDLQVVDAATAQQTAAYLVKDLVTSSRVVWEMTGAQKKGRGAQQRTMWQVARDLAETRGGADLRVWQAFCSGIVRKKYLSWSVGLRERYGLEGEVEQVVQPVSPVDSPVDELVDDPVQEVESEDRIKSDRKTVAFARIQRDVWMRVWNRYGLHADLIETAEIALAEVQETSDHDEQVEHVQRAVDACLQRWVGTRELNQGQIAADRRRRFSDDAVVAASVNRRGASVCVLAPFDEPN